MLEPLPQIQRLRRRLSEIDHLQRAMSVLEWDQETYMPPGGAGARAEHLATLSALQHRLLVDDETGRLLGAAEDEVGAAGLDPDDDAACLVRAARRDYTQAARLPSDLVEEMARVAALAYDVWVGARSANDFAAFAPWLRRSYDLARRQAGYLGYEGHPYDALLDLYEPGMTVTRLRPLFARLRAGIVPLVRAIAARADVVDDAVLHQTYDEGAQLRFSGEMARRIGYDFTRGRLDLTVHPFARAFSRDDVRITTRVDTGFLSTCLMGVLHEAGHGLYEQNVAVTLAGTPLSNAASLGLHESQSRLWENVVGRSKGFWSAVFPSAQEAFPTQLGGADADTLYRALNRVSPSLIRIEADEVTYTLHIMLRFDLEMRLLEGTLDVDDLPEAWNAGMRDYLGVTPPDDATGVLQDVHWSSGLIGYFPTYAIGSILSVQFYDAAVAAAPAIPDQIAQGEFSLLLSWLKDRVHRHGRKFDPDVIVARATGRPLDVEPYLRYLREKFGALYGLPSENLT